MIATAPGTDPDAFRARFPMLERTVHLASCSLAARSVDVDAALTAMLEAMALGAPWELFEAQADEARARFAALVGARPEQVALVPNASTGAYQVASTLDWDERPVVVTSGAEFPSLAHVWLAQEPRGAVVRYADEAGDPDPGPGYLGAIDSRTRLVSVPLVTYREAARLPVRDVVEAAHAAGARVLVDAYQAVGVEPVDVTELGCDYLVAGSSKYLLGLPGAAFLYVRAPATEDRLPQLTGWLARVDPFSFDPHRLDFPAQARRFETGTPSIPSLYAANAGLALVAALDLRAVRDHVRGLTTRAATRLAAQGERLETREPVERGAHVALLDPDPAALAGWLRGRRIVVSPRGDVVRLSFHYYSSAGDVDAVCEEVARYRREASASGAGRTGAPRWRHELSAWRSRGGADPFPYDAVLDEYHRVGKHFVSPELLNELDDVRRALPEMAGAAAERVRRERFLDTALDKRDGRYDYPTYLALGLLPLPETGCPDVPAADRRRDVLLAGLVTDALRFELAADAGATALLPQMRPDQRTLVKRCRLGMQVIEPCLRRLGLSDDVDCQDPVGAARLACRRVAEAGDDDRLALRLSMLPVYVIHDEWMFIRVLQSFETVFALLAVHIEAALTALGAGDAGPAVRHLDSCDAALREAAPLFSLLATMQVEAFRTFREYTEGASAIQSRGYKLVESLCRTPDRPRLDSIAYLSVPEVRERVLSGQATLDDALRAAEAAGRSSPDELGQVELAMQRFAGTILTWRRTHYRLAVRMLGERTGTGYTEGTPYLDAVRTIPVFLSTEGGESPDR